MQVRVLISALSLGVTLGLPLAHASEELATKYACMACHDAVAQRVGPSFQAIAEKYKSDDGAAETLAGKVKAGGSGNWGQIPMPPNAAVSDEDAAVIIQWILDR